MPGGESVASTASVAPRTGIEIFELKQPDALELWRIASEVAPGATANAAARTYNPPRSTQPARG